MNKTILILEDNLNVLSLLLSCLCEIEANQPYDFSVIIFTNSQQVEDYINCNKKAAFDIILLDRDCAINKSFHILDIERFGAEKIIAISSVPKWNLEAKKRGVKKIIEKDLSNITDFSAKVSKEIKRRLSPSWLTRFFQ